MDKIKIDEQYWKDFGHWHIKMHFLTKEIERLKKQNDLTSLVSAFLLEAQYIEFHLQGFITELEIINDTEPDFLKLSCQKSNKEICKMSLGDLKDEVKKLGFEVKRDGGDDIYEDSFGEKHAIPTVVKFKKNGVEFTYVY